MTERAQRASSRKRAASKTAGGRAKRASKKAPARKRAPASPTAEDLLADAKRTLRELLCDDDARIRLEAAKTIADRFGAPVLAKTEATHDLEGARAVHVLIESEERAHQIARGDDHGSR
jgi:hypothetical protein